MINDKRALLNRNHNSRKVDNFYVEFYKMPETAMNYLGKQVKSMGRPTLRFDMTEIASRRGVRKDRNRVHYDPVTFTFFDDAEGLTSMFLYAQILAQAKADMEGGAVQFDDGERHYKFDIKVELFNEKDQVSEGYFLKDCLISEISHSEAIYESSEDNVITVSIEVTDIDFFIMDRYQSLNA